MDPFVLVIFGITSNLAQIKLIPALYDLEDKGLLPPDTTILGIARSPKTQEELQNYLFEVLSAKNRHHLHGVKKEVADSLIRKFRYLDGQVQDPNFYLSLKQYLDNLKVANRIYYLATYPDLYPQIFQNLKGAKLNFQKNCWVRIMIEKPIGNDFPSARKLNKLLLNFFKEEQIFRLDHYLGKEVIQNILTFRFGNGLFEPLMNNKFIDHIQVTALEDFGIGKRGSYYDSVGALKDVGQNHLLQMLVFATMDPPKEFNNREVTAQRVKVLKKLIPYPNSLVLGQYQGYLKEENVAKTSSSDTFFAFKTEVRSTRLKGVPIYVRGGKKLANSTTEISIIFKTPQNRLFKYQDLGEIPNVLTYRLYPNEGIGVQILVKKPGHKLELSPEFMQFCYRNKSSLTDPYEKLILDAIKGDPTFFNDSAEVEAQWKFIDSITPKVSKPTIYEVGGYGPKEVDEMIRRDGKYWLTPSLIFCTI